MVAAVAKSKDDDDSNKQLIATCVLEGSGVLGFVTLIQVSFVLSRIERSVSRL